MGVMKRLSGEGLRVTLKVKGTFFDSPRVMAAVDRARRRNLSRIGYWIMKDARWSLRPARRKTLGEMHPKEREQYDRAVRWARRHGRKRPRRPYRPSRPGEPPRVRPGSLLKRRLFFGYDESADSVVIGPERVRRASVPHALEHGGIMPTSRRIRELTGVSVYNLEPRPLMGPALRRAQPKMAKKWRDSVRSSG